ncbi:MAG: ribonuclease P protein component [Armatimonadota bacterium]
MLPRNARLKCKSDFGRVYCRGSSYATDLIVMYVVPARGECTRVGFSVSGKVGKSVIRNRTRRLLREAVRLLLPKVRQKYDVVIVARKSAADAGFAELRSDVEKLFRRAGLIAGGPKKCKVQELQPARISGQSDSPG